MSKQLGLAIGISAGANVLGATELREQLGPESVVVTLLCNSNKKYLSTDLIKAEPPLRNPLLGQTRHYFYFSVSKGLDKTHSFMKKTLLAGFALFGVAQAHAQILTPVHWSYAAKKTSATEATVFLKATIDAGWHVYSQNIKEGGPVKTTITFGPSKTYTLVGKPQEPAPITRLEKVFGMEVSYFANSVIFQQKVKLTGKGPVTVKGTLEYMACNDEKCLPPDEVTFSIPVK